TCAVELAVRKSVDREDITPVQVQPALEFEQRRPVAQLDRGAMTQAQAEAEGGARTDPLPHRQCVSLERLESLRPRLAAMDVGAVGEVQAVVELHGRSQNTCALRSGKGDF